MPKERMQMELGRAQNHSQKQRGWKELLGISSPTSCPKHIQVQQLAQGFLQVGLDTSNEGGSLLQFFRDNTCLKLLFIGEIMTQVFQSLAKK